jgi:hypothetical protein
MRFFFLRTACIIFSFLFFSRIRDEVEVKKNNAGENARRAEEVAKVSYPV